MRLVVVYVGDFNMAGPKENLAKGWGLLPVWIHIWDAISPRGLWFSAMGKVMLR